MTSHDKFENKRCDVTANLDCNAQIARTLIRVLLQYNAAVDFLQQLNATEISKATDSATLFRGNTMASKVQE